MTDDAYSSATEYAVYKDKNFHIRLKIQKLEKYGALCDEKKMISRPKKQNDNRLEATIDH